MKYYIKRSIVSYYWGGDPDNINCCGWVREVKDATMFENLAKAHKVADILLRDNSDCDLHVCDEDGKRMKKPDLFKAYDRAMRGIM